MVAEAIGGVMMMAGGGMLSATSIRLLTAQQRWRASVEFGAGLARAYADTTDEPVPAEMIELLARLP